MYKNNFTAAINWFDSSTTQYYEGQKRYELANHLGNVLATVSDKKLPVDTTTILNTAQYYEPEIINSEDFYPFGFEEPGRTYRILRDSLYRFNFNGKEKTDEIYGTAIGYDYGARFNDVRLGRFLSIDPLKWKFPMLSTYQFGSNTPIWATDIDGKEARVYTDAALPTHCFISVLDDKEILHVYTYGQYGQGYKDGKSHPSGEGALVHLQGDAAKAYLYYEFTHDEISVFEINKDYVNKDQVMKYYQGIHDDWHEPAEHETIGKTNAVSYIYLSKGSWADIYSYYDFLPIGDDENNCVTVAASGIQAGGCSFLNSNFMPSKVDAWLHTMATDPRWNTLSPPPVADVTNQASDAATSGGTQDNSQCPYAPPGTYSNSTDQSAPTNYITLPSDPDNNSQPTTGGN